MDGMWFLAGSLDQTAVIMPTDDDMIYLVGN